MNALETAKRFVELLELRDLKQLPSLMAEDFKATGGAAELTRLQALGFLQILFTAFPDHRFNFTDYQGQEDRVTCSARETGTHTGTLDLKPFGMPVTLPATGKAFALPKCTYTFRVTNGQVSFYQEEVVPGGGMAGILEQLGVKRA